jgi:hypothetical protein
MTPEQYQWRTREEWAKDRHAFHHDRFENLAIEFMLTDEEVHLALQALRELWKAQGKRLRALKIPAAWRQQPGESQKAHHARINAMPQADQDLWRAQAEPRWMIDAINKATKALKEGLAADLVRIHDKEVKEILTPILGRYQEAKDVATKVRKQKILATPIDDAAWEKECQRRAEIDERRRRRNL